MPAVPGCIRMIETNEQLMEILRNRRNYLGLDGFDPRVLKVLAKLDRAFFVPKGTENVYEDEPAQIGEGQTCSQPSMVAAMATVMELSAGMNVLEIGTGCGYSAAATAPLLEPGGMLITMEIIPSLQKQAKKNIERVSEVKNIKFVVGDGSGGFPEVAPYDRIYFTAGAGKSFNEKPLLDQLKPDGILLYPEAQGQMFLVRKTASGLERRTLGGVGFVLLRGENSGF